MNDRKKVCCIGHFAFGREFFDGQTVKTKTVTSALEAELGCNNVIKKDTCGKAVMLLKLPGVIISSLKRCDNIVIFPAHNGLRVIAPLLAFWNIFFHRALHYCVIGGWLPDFIKKHKYLMGPLKSFTAIYVETETMRADLNSQGFDNVAVMPNFKNLKILKPDELCYSVGEPFKLCTFSRVSKQKGIEDAVSAVEFVNKKYGRTVYTLDIYGMVDAGQTEWFDALKATFPEYVEYKGAVDSDKSVETLKNYYALLFPTFYDGEGFAGTLIDAMTAGIPSLASDWKYNSEIVNSRNGVLFKAHSAESLAGILENSIHGELNTLKPNCLAEAEKYTSTAAIKILTSRLV